jgi:two-component system sensor histidine kinase RstB
MLKALAKLLVLLIIPVIFFIVSDSLNPIRSLANWVSQKQASLTYLGTFRKIDEQLSKAAKPDREKLFTSIATLFPSNLSLVNIEELSINDRIRDRLEKGKLAHLDTNRDVFAYKLKSIDNKVMTISVELSERETIYRFTKGPLLLAQKMLAETPEELIDAKTDELTQMLGYNVRIGKISDTPEAKSGLPFRTHKELSWFEYDDDTLLFVLSMDSQRSILIGPVSDSLLRTTNLVAIVIFVVLLLLVFASALLIWLWPLWRDHKSLNKQARAFGAGHLASRVDIPKSSFAADLGNAFNQMADNIQQLIRSNQDLNNAVAHDLRTPLARLRFALEMMTASDCTALDQKRYEASMHTSINLLDQLINQTLVHSRYSQVPDIKQFRKVNFAKHIADEITQFQLNFDKLKFRTEISKALEATCQIVDDKAMRRALSNLLSNAVKFANKEILVRYYEHQGWLHLDVADDGIGIDVQHANQLLKPFVKAGDIRRPMASGHGLGLAIVDQISKWHKGKVVIDRSSLGGALVQIRWQPQELSTLQVSASSSSV